jgi:hypothetical protein
VLSAAVVGLIAWVAVRVSVARLEVQVKAEAEKTQERAEAQDLRNDERYQAAVDRMEKFERFLGLGGQETAFMPRRECALLEGRMDSWLRSIERDIHQVNTVAADVQRRVQAIESTASRDGGSA